MDAGFVVTAESGLRSIPHISDSDMEMNLHHKPMLCICVIIKQHVCASLCENSINQNSISHIIGLRSFMYIDFTLAILKACLFVTHTFGFLLCNYFTTMI